MTSFLDPEEEKRGKILEKCKEIDDLMAQLAEMYPSVHSFDHTCTCEDDCRCIFQNEAIQDESILNLPIGRKNKCVCSCGQSFCLCSKLSKILREINMMNYDIKCDCIDGKVDVESILKVKLFCNCKNDNNCLCSIILQEFAMCDGSVCCSCLDVENEGKMLKCLNSAASSCTCSPLKRSANSLCGCGRAMIGTAEPMEIISCTTFQSQVSVLIASTTPVDDDSLINFFNPDEASTCEDLNKE
ncbi:PREDICTED: uncharacterized protein LOC108566409 [Nicrophorus vespilloides]|uniref:Uncharacterized protein LOC108566409 n=1 Tax=Nicrophorus vespilloides TaxID=110193 RepID=A0ABM1N4K9_NICVS|nr:PREDICTED: uncharacterized protein LOC108566409 [Nicrophorus vespilloides]